MAPKAEYIRKKINSIDYIDLKFLCANVWHKQDQGKW